MALGAGPPGNPRVGMLATVRNQELCHLVTIEHADGEIFYTLNEGRCSSNGGESIIVRCDRTVRWVTDLGAGAQAVGLR